MPNVGAGISGVGGDVQIGGASVHEIRKWSWNPKCSTPMYASNRTSGFKRSVAGVKSGTGSLDYVHDPSTPIWLSIGEGNYVTLSLMFYNAATAPPWALTSAGTWTVPALIGSIRYDVDIDEGNIIGGTADFVTNGAWTIPSAGLTLPPGLIPNPDGSPPPEAEPTLSPRGLSFLSPDQLLSLAKQVEAKAKEMGVKAPSWAPTPSEVRYAQAVA